MRFLEIKAPAKINIGLNIVEKRNDGYHNLETFFYPIYDLFDVLTFEKADTFSFQIIENQDTSIKYKDKLEDNLVVKAKKLLEENTSKKLDVKITLKKNIPIGAGLGGGSSDAAVTLVSLNEMFDLKVYTKKLIDLSLQLGSDVPFFIQTKPAIGKSRGEQLRTMDFKIPNYILIVNPNIHISTKEAFENVTPAPSKINYDAAFRSFKIFVKYQNKIENDFENFVFNSYPAVKEIKHTLLENGAIFSLMSGSGSTVYGLFESYEQAESVSKLFPKNYFTFISSPENF